MKNSLSLKQKTAFGIITAGFICLLFVVIWSMTGARDYVFDLKALASDHIGNEGCLIIDPGMDEALHSTRFSLRKGTYRIEFYYASDADYSVFIPLDNDNNITVYVPAGEGVATGEIALEWPTDRAYFVFNPPELGSVRIDSIRLHSDRMIYTDGVYQILLLVISYIILLIILIKYAGFTREKKTVLLCMLIMIVMINLPYYLEFYPGDTGQWEFLNPVNALTRFGIDTRAHLLRLEGDMYGLLDGQFPVVISPNFLNENGELTFLYPSIFLYPFALMRILGASMPFVFRLICVLINICTLASMYFCCRRMGVGYRLALLISAAYLFEPHRLWVMFGQGAGCGAGIAYIFIPLALTGVYRILSQKKDGVYLLAFGVTGVFQSHITSLVLLMSLLVVLFIVFIRELLQDSGTGIKLAGKAVLLGGIMNLGVMIPFVFYYYSGVNTSALVWGNWDEVLLGFPELLTDNMSLFFAAGLVIAIAAAMMFRRKTVEYKMALTMLVFLIVFFFMTTAFFPWDFLMEKSSLAVSFTNVMQLPERFYTIMAPTMLLSFLIFVNVQNPDETGRRIMALIIFGTLVYGAVINIGGYLTTGPLLYDQVTGDMNTKQLFDYLPDRDDLEPEMEFSGTASLSDWDNVESISYHKQGTRVDYTYITEQPDEYAEFPLLEYKGYVVWDESGNMLDHGAGDMGRIMVKLLGDGRQHEIHTAYRVKKVFTLLYLFSIFFTGAVMIFPWLIKVRQNNIISE